MQKFVFSLSIVFVGLSLGYVFQILYNRKIVKLPFEINTFRKILQKTALLFFNPVAFLGAVWIVNLNNIRIAAMPFIGLTALVLGGFLAYLFSRMQRMTRRQTGSYIVSGGFTNIGSIGALICFIFLGEPAFALVPFYKLFEEFSYYAFGFPIAKSFSSEFKKKENPIYRIKKVFKDPFVIVALSSISLGFILNLSGVKRPDFYQTVNMIFIPIASILLLSSIGMAMKFERAFKYLKAGSYIALIKFMIVPATVTFLGYLIGLGNIDNGLPLKVVLILSSMPVGFIAMVPPSIYDLDVDLANSSWLVTNFLLIIVIPILLFLTSYLI